MNTFRFGGQTIRTKVNVMVPREGPAEVIDVTAAMYEPPIGQSMLDDIFDDPGEGSGSEGAR